MESVEDCSVRSAWTSMARTSLVLAARVNNQNTFLMAEVSSFICLASLHEKTFLLKILAMGRNKDVANAII